MVYEQRDTNPWASLSDKKERPHSHDRSSYQEAWTPQLWLHFKDALWIKECPLWYILILPRHKKRTVVLCWLFFSTSMGVLRLAINLATKDVGVSCEKCLFSIKKPPCPGAAYCMRHQVIQTGCIIIKAIWRLIVRSNGTFWLSTCC